MDFHIPLPVDFAEEETAVVLARAKKLVSRAADVAGSLLAARKTATAAEEGVEIRTKDDDIKDLFAVGDYSGAMRELVHKYDVPIIQSPEQVRNICKNVLIEKALYGEDDKVQLKAVELLGKVKDIGLFEERSTITIENMDSETIVSRLKEKLDKLRFGSVSDVTDVKEIKE